MRKQAFAGMSPVGERHPFLQAGVERAYRAVIRRDCVFRRLVIGSDEHESLVVEHVRIVRFGSTITHELNIGSGPMPSSAFRTGFSPEQIAFGDSERPIEFDEPLNAGDTIEVVIQNQDAGCGHVANPGLVVSWEDA